MNARISRREVLRRSLLNAAAPADRAAAATVLAIRLLFLVGFVAVAVALLR